jgi:hypothetical protein
MLTVSRRFSPPRTPNLPHWTEQSPPPIPIASTRFIYRPTNTPNPRIAPPRTYTSNLARNGASNWWKSTDFRRRWPRSNTTRLLVHLFSRLFFQSMQDHNTDHFPMFQLARKPGSPALGRTVPRSLPIISPASYIAQQTLPDYV